MSKPTSHDLMRKAMAKHGITAAELIDYIHKDLGGDRQRVVDAVTRFVNGGPGSIAVHAGIIGISVDQQDATVH